MLGVFFSFFVLFGLVNQSKPPSNEKQRTNKHNNLFYMPVGQKEKPNGDHRWMVDIFPLYQNI